MFDKGIGKTVQIMSSHFLLCSSFIKLDPNAVTFAIGNESLEPYYSETGGGLSIISAYESHDNSVVIKKCNFEDNKSSYGGGLYFTFVQHSAHNGIIVEKCKMTRNAGSKVCGGILITSRTHADANSVTLRDCSVFSNNAEGGGAMAIIFRSSGPSCVVSTGRSMDFQVRNCNVFDNIAAPGSALQLMSELPRGSVP